MDMPPHARAGQIGRGHRFAAYPRCSTDIGGVMQTNETFVGPPCDDPEQLASLPEPLVSVLRQKNGFIWFRGGLHVRGVCKQPDWHSLLAAASGPTAFHELYWNVRATDVPFAEDCVGDQFVLRDGVVFRLAAEVGDIEDLGIGATEFFARVQEDPVKFLQLNPLLQFESEGGRLVPGELLAAYPPFFAQQSGDGVSLRAISAGERRRFLADIANQIRDLPDGSSVRFVVAGQSASRRTRG
jgi:hypothetical protein